MMKRKLTYFLLFTFTILIVYSCSFTQKIKDGEMAFDRKQYSVAINMLSEEFDRTEYQELKARKAFLIAESYSAINNVPSAIEWYKNAFDLNYGDRTLIRLAYALKKNEQYSEAVNVFRAVEERIGRNNEFTKEIAECAQAAQWMNNAESSPFEVETIPENSAYSDYAPTIFENGQLVFSSDRNNNQNGDIYKWTGAWFSDLFIVNQFSKEVIPFDRSVNSLNNEGTATFNSDFSEIIFTRCRSELDDDYCKLMSSRRTSSGWTDPQYLNFIEERINYGHPSLHQNDSILFFAAQQEEGFGGYDIYYAQRINEIWSNPQILGSGVNTIGNEKFPFIYEDTLYFASDGWPGMGGLDIFKTHIDDEGSWSPVENLQPPFNSGGDDFSLVVDIQTRKSEGEFTGYFTSSRLGSKNDDIYSFKSRIIENPVDEIVEEPDEVKELKLYLAIKTYEPRYLIENDHQSGVVGRNNLTNAKISIQDSNGESVYNSGDKGFLVIDIDKDESYSIKVEKQDYLTRIGQFSPSNPPESGEKTYNISIELEKIFTDREIVLENIYYDFNESFIREDAKPSLNELANLLQNNPNIKIQLFSHTDCRGDDDFNINLSQARAQAAVDYLIGIGISAERMEATGLGETRPAVNCYCETCSEVEHQENRRTSFKIIEY